MPATPRSDPLRFRVDRIPNKKVCSKGKVDLGQYRLPGVGLLHLHQGLKHISLQPALQQHPIRTDADCGDRPLRRGNQGRGRDPRLLQHNHLHLDHLPKTVHNEPQVRTVRGELEAVPAKRALHGLQAVALKDPFDPLVQ